MLAQLELKLHAKQQDLTYCQSSNLQGVLMEQLSSDYADILHMQKLNPYSQSLEKEGDAIIWKIKTLNQDAYDNIIVPILDSKFKEFMIQKKNISVEIIDKKLTTVRKEKLLEEFYDTGHHDKYINLEFITPTSFKSNDHYVIIPDTKLIFQSLMNKYSASSNMEMFDQETLEQLVSCFNITQYRLKSTTFPMEGIRIPAFIGSMSMKINGPSTMARYAKMLTTFGEYSGMGIKTAMGMGAIRSKDWRKVNE